MKAKITQGLVNKTKPTEKAAMDIMDTELKGFILRITKSGNRTYYARYKSKSIGWTRYRIGDAAKLTAAQAREMAKEVLARVELGEDPGEAERKAKANTLGAYLENTYGPWVVENRKAGVATLQRLQSAFKPLHSKRMSEINAWTIERWRSDKKKAKKVKAVTLNREVAMLKAALNQAVKWKILDEYPLKGLGMLPERDSQQKVRYLSQEEEKSLMDALDSREERIRTERDSANDWRVERGYKLYQDLRLLPYADHLKPMVLLSLNTGLRKGELLHLAWGNVDLQQAMLTVQADVAKSGKVRHVPLNETALSSLKGWRKCSKGNAWVFPSKEGKPFDHVNKSWRNLLHDAGIVDFRWHDMRHDFASKLVMAGVDLNTVRELLGHSDLKMTIRYAHLAPEHKRAAVEALDKPGNIVGLESSRI